MDPQRRTAPAAGARRRLAAARVPGPRAGVPAQALAAVTGPLLSTYTAALIANTAVPVWHDARRELPFVFASSSAAAAGGALTALTPRGSAGAARALGVAGAAAELGRWSSCERRLDPRVARSYGHGAARRPTAQRASAPPRAPLLIGALGRRSRAAAVAGGLALCAGSALTRWAIFQAGRRRPTIRSRPSARSATASTADSR